MKDWGKKKEDGRRGRIVGEGFRKEDKGRDMREKEGKENRSLRRE